jgi:hypothetical protein
LHNQQAQAQSNRFEGLKRRMKIKLRSPLALGQHIRWNWYSSGDGNRASRHDTESVGEPEGNACAKSSSDAALKLTATMRRWGRTRAISRSHREQRRAHIPVAMLAVVLRCNLRLLVREFALLNKEFRCGFVSVAAFTRERCVRSAQAPACML